MIAFLNPWVLAGLAAASIPLLLHLIARREPPTIIFPAVRYLIDTTREHDRRLKLRNLLLLLVRTLLIILVVLAAAGPTAPLKGTGTHAPAALVLIVDNSLSSGAVIDGTPRLAEFQAAARRVLGRAGAGDDLWLLSADGIARKGTAAALERMVDSLRPLARRLDLGDALLTAQGVIEAQERPGEIVLITDLQASAISPADLSVPLLVARPDEGQIANSGIDSVSTGVQPWSGDGGQVLVTVGSTGDHPVPLTARLGERPPRQVLASAGSPTAVNLDEASPGWWTLRVELDPDELLADNVWIDAVRIAPPASVSWDPEARFVSTAAEVLQANGRIREGGEISFGNLEQGFSVV
ncbi:MAG: BatA domain-containing protein, partial [Gemmatimonadales bacterium]